jgi:predicted DNA-binding transcriptional regulator YafY
MSFNKLALLRYKIIDECLQNRFKRWTLDMLIDAVSDALYEYEGIDSGVSKRTIQLDIQNMRSDKLGYNAPIIVIDRKYYQYEDKDFTIKNARISSQDVEKLNDIIQLLNQFKGFNYFEDINEMVGRLEDKIIRSTDSQNYYIDFEKNELLKGLNWIEPLLKAIKNKTVIQIEYQSFKAKQSSQLIVHPYLLKEYRNRWFLLCCSHKGKKIVLHALDRILNIEFLNSEKFYITKDFDVKTFFDNVIGVTKSHGQEPMKVRLWLNRESAPYVLTKPFHPSQKLISQDEEGIVIDLDVIHNFELEREIIGFAETIKVLSPRQLVHRIKKKLEGASNHYSERY